MSNHTCGRWQTVCNTLPSIAIQSAQIPPYLPVARYRKTIVTSELLPPSNRATTPPLSGSNRTIPMNQPGFFLSSQVTTPTAWTWATRRRDSVTWTRREGRTVLPTITGRWWFWPFSPAGDRFVVRSFRTSNGRSGSASRPRVSRCSA